jgi:hypothetical protein
MPPILLNDPAPYLERNGLAEPTRAPAARLDLSMNPLMGYPTAPPLPQASVVRPAARPAAPDSANSAVWPPGDAT